MINRFSMWAICSLAAKSAWARRFTLSLLVICVMLSTALFLGVERIGYTARHSTENAVSGIDLIVGPRQGELPLMLYSVFFIGHSAQNMRYSAFQSLATHHSVAFAVPIVLGDSVAGFPVVGTSPQYFERGLAGSASAASAPLATGTLFDQEAIFEVVLGHEVAKALRLHIGKTVVLSHGKSLQNAMDKHEEAYEHGADDDQVADTDDELHPRHADKPFRVVGVLKPTHTPADRALFVPLRGISAIHLDWIGGMPTPGFNIPAQSVQKFDLTPKTITAGLIGLKNRAEVLSMQRYINTQPHEPLLAVMPAMAIAELWKMLSWADKALSGMSLLVLIVGLCGLIATNLAILSHRSRELAIFRALGAGIADIMLLLLSEGLVVTLIGVLLGVILFGLSMVLFAPVLHLTLGIHLPLFPVHSLFTHSEWRRLLAVMTLGGLASLIPAISAMRIALSNGLQPKQ